jgi:uncharacterized protein
LIRLITLILGLSALASCADKPKNLIQAICTDDAKAVRSELSNGASPNQFADTNDKNMLPLFIATDIFFCKYPTPIHQKEIVSALIEYGADVNLRGKGMATPIMMAASGVDTDVLELLIAKGAKLNEQDAIGNTALMWISSDPRSLNIIKILIRNGANPKIRNHLGKNAYENALNLNSEVARYLQPLVGL